MTARKLIEKTDKLYPNVFPFGVKAMWLTEFDKRLSLEVISRYDENFSEIPSYDENPDSVLLIPDDFSEVYIRYLTMQFDITSGETARYHNSSALYNGSYLSFINYYNRTHRVRPHYICIE